MRVALLGTGAAGGWPNPFCACASCAAGRRDGRVRSSASALVDDVLLLDCGPDTPRQAARAGLPLDRVRAVLVTHAHPDHLEPSFLLAHAWASGAAPLRVVGPPSVVRACEPWIGPDGGVELVAVGPGDVVQVEGYAVRAVAAAHDVGDDVLTADAVLYDITAPDRSRLLYATDTGPLPEATIATLRGAAYDLVLLEETFGAVHDHGTGHHDLATFPRELARLREAGAITAATDVVATHLGHHNPPPPQLDRILAAWGARVVDDLTVIGTDRTEVTASRATVPPPRRTLLTGGARSGKSHEAERLLAAEPVVEYVATGGGREGDDDWAARVALHRARRPASWTTTETLDVAAVLRADGPPALVDCLSLWLAGRLDAAGAWGAEPGTPGRSAALDLVERDVADLVDALRGTARRVVLVTNEVGSGVVPEHESGRLYRDLLGRLNARVAAECEAVGLVVAGRVLPLVAPVPDPGSSAAAP